MKIIISCHLDTVFSDPMGTIENNVFTGPCDNIASILAVGRILGDVDATIELTNDEEKHMDGARYVARENDPKNTLIIVLDVTEDFKKSVNFTIENVSSIHTMHIRQALKDFKGRFKLNIVGEESEAWLYRDMGFCVLEIDIPVRGGLHNMYAEARTEDIKIVSEAIKALVSYFIDKDREILSDTYRVEIVTTPLKSDSQDLGDEAIELKDNINGMV